MDGWMSERTAGLGSAYIYIYIYIYKDRETVNKLHIAVEINSGAVKH